MAFVTSEITATPPYRITATKLSRTQRETKLQASGSRVSDFYGNGRYELKEQNDDNRN